MTITFGIQNVNPESVKSVMLRKFFQMVFIDNKRKALNIYTATVVGGRVSRQKSEGAESGAEPAADPAEPAETVETFISEFGEANEFRLKFDFIVRGNDDNDVLLITSQNITEGEHSFLSEIDCIQQVWGEECDVISNNQSKLTQKLKSISAVQVEPDSEVTAKLSGRPVLYIRDEKKAQEKGFKAIAIPGSFTPCDYQKEKSNVKIADGMERAFYCIEVPADCGRLEKGIELVNWVKTTIQFKHRLQDSNLNFCLRKELGISERTKFYAPDFTWYFSPPVKSFINNESSTVETKISAQADGFECETCTGSGGKPCTCPVRTGAQNTHTTRQFLNVINPVANKTTVNFWRWKFDDMISYRQKYRLATKNIFSPSLTFHQVREINIYLDTTDEHNRGNRQFILNLFISFALAFGIDSTRLSSAQPYFPFPQILAGDAWWLLLLTAFSINLLIRPPHAEKTRRYLLWRAVNIILTVFWILWVFIISKGGWVAAQILPVAGTIHLWCQGIFLGLLVTDWAYVLRNILRFKDPIFSTLLGDDIL